MEVTEMGARVEVKRAVVGMAEEATVEGVMEAAAKGSALGANSEADLAVAVLEQVNRAAGETWVVGLAKAVRVAGPAEDRAVRVDAEVVTQEEDSVTALLAAPAGKMGPTPLEGPRSLSLASRQACAILVR